MNGYWGQWLDLPASGPLYQAATAMTLAAIVVTQIGNLFAQRTERLSVFRIGLFSNRLIWIGIASELVLVLLITYVPFLQRIFGTESLLCSMSSPFRSDEAHVEETAAPSSTGPYAAPG